MLVKQVELQQDDGAKMVCWIDKEHAIVGHRFDLNLGGEELRSPVMTVIKVSDSERDITEIQQAQKNQRSFGGSIR